MDEETKQTGERLKLSDKYKFDLECNYSSTTYKTTIELYPKLHIEVSDLDGIQKKLTASKIELIAKIPLFDRVGVFRLNILEGLDKPCSYYIYGYPKTNYCSAESLKDALLRLNKQVGKKHRKNKSLCFKKLELIADNKEKTD